MRGPKNSDPVDFNSLELGTISDFSFESGTDQSSYHTPLGEQGKMEATWYIIATLSRFPTRLVQIAHLPFSHQKETYVRYKHDSTWSAWYKIVTATPPQEFELPLTSYVTALYNCRYSRDQFGRVVCYGTMAPTQDISSGVTLATLPVGYRPVSTMRVAGIIVSQSGAVLAEGIGIAPTGQISLRGVNVPGTAQYVSFSVQFPSAS